MLVSPPKLHVVIGGAFQKWLDLECMRLGLVHSAMLGLSTLRLRVYDS